MLPTPTPSPVPSLPRALARGDDELCTSGSEREWDELIAAFPLPEQAQRAPPMTRPRSASLSADIMRNDARRAEAASVPLDEGRTDSVPVNDGEVEQQNVGMGTPFVFPSIRPSLTTPPVSPASPVTQTITAAPGIFAPRPAQATPTVVHLEDTVAAGPTVSTARKGKKRARIDSTSPSPASATRTMAPLPSTPSHRMRLPPALRVTRLSTPGQGPVASPYRQLASSTAEVIAATLRAIPGSELLAPGGRTAPTRTPAARQIQPMASSSRTRTHDENANPAPLNPDLEMEVDLQLVYNQSASRSQAPFGMPLQPVDINRLRFPEAFEHMGPLPERRDETGAYQDPPNMNFDDGYEPRGLMSVRDRPPTPHPLRTLSNGSASTNSTSVVTHSAAALAASFTTVSQPIPISNAMRSGGANAATTTYHAAPPQLGQGAMGAHHFTDVPPEGFPVIYRADPDGIFAGLTQARAVALREEHALIATVHNLPLLTRNEIRPVVAAVASVVCQVSGDLNTLVVAPVRDWSAANTRRVNPGAFGIIGLTVEGALRVLARSSWSTQAITIHVDRAVIAPSRFMFVIGEFEHDHNGSILKTVFGVFSGPIVFPLITHYVRTHPDYLAVHEEVAARAILASLEVRVSTLEDGSIQAAVYCDPPTLVPSRWSEWRGRVASLPFIDPLNETGVVSRIPPCVACHGEDHSFRLCPFQNVPGWNAPPPGASWAQPGFGATQNAAQTAAVTPAPQQQQQQHQTGGNLATRGRAYSARRGQNMSNGTRRDHQGGASGSNGAGPSRGGGGYGGGRGGGHVPF